MGPGWGGNSSGVDLLSGRVCGHRGVRGVSGGEREGGSEVAVVQGAAPRRKPAQTPVCGAALTPSSTTFSQ